MILISISSQQELYYVTHQFFLSNNSIYLLVFDLSKPDYKQLDYWLQNILVSRVKEDDHLKRKSWNTPTVIVGTHLDLCSADQVVAVENQLRFVLTYDTYIRWSAIIFYVYLFCRQKKFTYIYIYTNRERLSHLKQYLNGLWFVSCKTGTNVAELRANLFQVAFECGLVGKEQPKSFEDLANTIRELRQDNSES